MGKMSRLGNDLYQGRKSVNFVGKPWLWYGISAVVIALSLLVLVLKPLNMGVEFTGGTALTVPVGPVHSRVLANWYRRNWSENGAACSWSSNRMVRSPSENAQASVTMRSKAGSGSSGAPASSSAASTTGGGAGSSRRKSW